MREACGAAVVDAPAHVSVNASARSTEQLSRADVPPPRTARERRELAESTLLVSDYLREKIAEEHPRLTPPSRKDLLSAVKSYFSSALENLKLQREGSVAWRRSRAAALHPRRPGPHGRGLGGHRAVP